MRTSLISLVACLALAACTHEAPDSNFDSDLGSGPGGNATDGEDADSTGGTAGNDDAPQMDPGPRSQLRRLTNEQFINALTDLFDSSLDMQTVLPPDVISEFYATVGGANSVVSELGLERYEQAGREVVQTVLADPNLREMVVPCDASTQTCRAESLEALARRAWRRPVTEEELDRLQALSDENAARYSDGLRGLESGFVAILISPNFLYLTEVGEDDPARPDVRRYTSLEMASRLSFFLWNGLPDDELLGLGEAGELHDAKVLDEQIHRMLASDLTRRGTLRFFEEYLGIVNIPDLAKDPTLFPEVSPTLQTAMRVEVRRMIEHTLFDEDRPVFDLLRTTTTFVDPQLAELYGVTADVEAGHTTRVQLPESGPRLGLLGTAAFLASRARANRTAPTLRGAYVQKRLRCVEVPPPPPGTDNSLPADDGDVEITVREMLEEHRSNPDCASCHNLMDPIGLGLERFDAIGRIRDTELGAPIDDSGALDGKAFEGLPGLVDLLVDDPAVARCFVVQLHRYATGSIEAPIEEPSIDGLADTFAQSEGRLLDYLPHYLKSDAFVRLAKPE
jgi:hypothetical protein